jgi:hypothetical protein
MAFSDDVKKAQDALARANGITNVIGNAVDSITGQEPSADAKADANFVGNGGKVGEKTLNLKTSAQQHGGFGEFTSAATLAYHGFNHRGYQNPIQANTDNQGLTFFTRPRLNLSYDNIVRDRIFAVLAGDKEMSVQRAVRAWLDPVGSKITGNSGSGTKQKNATRENYHCPLVDDENIFITLLSNNLMTISGWQDPYVDTFTSTEGVYKEQWSMIDGPSKFHGVFSLNATFRNIVDDPITLMFHIWTSYAARVYDGTFNPYNDAIFENYIDYQTRIYRLILDHSRTYVTKICATGAAFPTANNLGAVFNYNQDKPNTDEIDQVSINFQCIGAIYNDPILVDAFNRSTYITNPNLIDGNRETYYTKIQPNEKMAFNYFGYPHINPKTMELEWWVKKEDYKRIMEGYGLLTTLDKEKSTNPLVQMVGGLEIPKIPGLIR